MKAAGSSQEHWQKMKESSGENFQVRWHLNRVAIESGNPVFMAADREHGREMAIPRTTVL